MTYYTTLLENLKLRFDCIEKTKKYKLNGDLTENEYLALCSAIDTYITVQKRNGTSES